LLNDSLLRCEFQADINGDQASVGAKERRQPRRPSSQHDPGNVFASVGIDHDEIDLSSGPFAQFVEIMVVEIVIDKEPPREGSGAMISDPDRLLPCHRIAPTSLYAIEIANSAKAALP
jgi:hypothetical protein